MRNRRRQGSSCAAERATQACWLRVAAVALLVGTVATTHLSGAAPASAQQQNPTIDPATGEPPGAPTGCCCFPKADSPGSGTVLCKPALTEFDCKAQCAELRDGRLPSGCRWTKGACPTR